MKAAAMRRKAKETLERAGSGRMPYSNAEWLRWLEDNDERFRQLLKEATGTRRVIGARLCPLPSGLPCAPANLPGEKSTVAVLGWWLGRGCEVVGW